jgi:hypothetical protein
MLAGLSMDEAGPTKFDGDLLGENPKGAFGAIVEKSCAAAAQVTDLQAMAHLSFGDYTIQHYFW